MIAKIFRLPSTHTVTKNLKLESTYFCRSNYFTYDTRNDVDEDTITKENDAKVIESGDDLQDQWKMMESRVINKKSIRRTPDNNKPTRSTRYGSPWDAENV
jgi:hypothetical protein